MPQEIYCSVNSCHYWGQGNRCEADKIMVTADAAANNLPDNIDAPMHQSIQATPADTCMETCCKTFVPKNSGQVGVDGVTKGGAQMKGGGYQTT